jgi:GNAT superfamily N-acetyltransferase
MPTFNFSAGVPPDYAELVWQVFFSSRQRGINLGTHFPWMLPSEAAGRWVATLEDNGETIAGLVIKALDDSKQPQAAIGLVCVKPERQGQGWGRELLSLSIAAAWEAGIAALTLWTGKPEVYRGHGFEIDDDGLFGWVQSPGPAAGALAPPHHQLPWPDTAELNSRSRGLPPYAKSAMRLVAASQRAELVVIHDATGPTLAEWHGDEEVVVNLLMHTMPRRWRLNALGSDTLLPALVRAGAELQLQPSRLQMWLSPASHPRVGKGSQRLLDRI